MKSLLLSITLTAVFVVTVISSVHAEAAQPTASHTTTIGTVELNADSRYQDLSKVDAGSEIATHRFALLLPKGASLHPVQDENGKSFLQAEILVKDEKGQIIGSIDSAWAQDADGTPLATFFTIEGETLVQTIDTSTAAEKTAIAILTYTGNNAHRGAEGSNLHQSKAYVGVPSNYIYNLNHPRRTLHDYCTKSPDEFPNPVGTNASFRGPCARHDMCFENRTYSRFTCNSNLRANMRSNCAYYYAWYSPVRAACYDTADIYWVAVTANTLWPW